MRLSQKYSRVERILVATLDVNHVMLKAELVEKMKDLLDNCGFKSYEKTVSETDSKKKILIEF